MTEKVALWRKLFNGFYDESGKFIKQELDQAAKNIGIAKKTLDDYLFQIRLGKKYGFDFNENKDKKVGILRSFVKTNRGEKAQTEKQSDKALKDHIGKSKEEDIEIY